tara:strand:- start:1777 stop:2778 length:1002 start_codon:yes stop_codon:yes gene_type:complete
MEVDLKEYYRCKIDKNVLKELSKKSDIKGLIHIFIFFSLLIITGYLSFYNWGTLWGIFWILIYGNIYCFSNPIWHETGHRTAFKSKLLNEIFYYISCYMACFEPVRWRYTHFIHHGNTYSTDNPYDHEIEYGNDLKNTIIRLLKEIFPFGNLIYIKNDITFEVIKHSLAIETKVMKDSIPEKAKPKSILISRIYVLIWLSITLMSIYINSFLPVLLFILPHFYGKTLHKLVAFTQHAGLARDVKDLRLSARDMYLNPILSFLYWKMEYHCVHHMFPTVPSYNLDKLHNHLKDQLPKTKIGLIDAYRDIIPTLIKQKKDPNYHFPVSLPKEQNI